MARYKRRRYLVHPLQGRLILFNAIYFLVGIFGTWALVVGPLIARMNDGGRTAAARESDADVLLFLHQRLLIALGPALLLIAIHAVTLSHRVAGPLVRFRSVLRSLAEGDLTANTRLRRRDLLHEESDHFRRAQLRLAERVERLRRACGALREADAEPNGGPERTRALETLETELAEFRLPPEEPAARPEGEPEIGIPEHGTDEEAEDEAAAA